MSYNGDPATIAEELIGCGIFLISIPVIMWLWFKWDDYRYGPESQELISLEDAEQKPSYTESLEDKVVSDEMVKFEEEEYS